MRPLAVDFKRPYKLPLWAFWAASALFWVASIGLSAVAWQTYQKLRDVESQLQAAQHRKAELDARAKSAGELKPPPPYLQDAARIARIASFDVGKVLTALESVQVPGARLQSIDINAVDRAARIELDVPDAALSLRYLEALNADDAGRWQLAQLRTAGSPPLTQVVFEAKWPAGL